MNEPARFADSQALSRRARAGVLAVLVVVHGLILAGLIVAFAGPLVFTAPNRGDAPIRAITLDQPRPADPGKTPSGAAGAAGRRAEADQVIAAPARIETAAPVAPIVAGTGSAAQSGAAAAGEGTGGAASGNGPGSGGAGNGSGGGTRPEKIAGTLAEADYPKAGRARRIGTAVILILTVGTDGRVRACRVHQPSGDPEADAVTCKLAIERFRFNPARDGAGNPVEDEFGWQQRFFQP